MMSVFCTAQHGRGGLGNHRDRFGMSAAIVRHFATPVQTKPGMADMFERRTCSVYLARYQLFVCVHGELGGLGHSRMWLEVPAHVF